MAKLPPIDLPGMRVRELLHRGRRSDALEKLDAIISGGKAGPIALELAEYLKNAKRGRQPFGATHLWVEIGMENDLLRSEGLGYADRMENLCARYMLAQTQIETAIGKYEAGMEIIRAEASEN